MNLLALELATEACSVAVESADGRVASRHEVAPRQHADLALQWSAELLASLNLPKSSVDAVAVSVGPGAFTGVRLAIAMGQGMALALGVPLIGVSTLAVLAMSGVTDLTQPCRILAVIDARMGEVYAGRFEWDGAALHALTKEVVVAPDALDLDGIDEAWTAVGTGIDAVNGVLRARLTCPMDASALPNALSLLRLARATTPQAPDDVTPTYLRDNVALTLAEQRARRESAQKKSPTNP